MPLWLHWWNAIWLLRAGCSRLRTFLWFVTCVAGLTVRADLLGVTSIVRALGLHPRLYHRLLDHFHGDGVKLDAMSALWAQTVVRLTTVRLKAEQIQLDRKHGVLRSVRGIQKVFI